MNTKDFYIAAYKSNAAGNAATSGVLGGAARDAKRSLHFTHGADYSSEEDSPYAPVIRKAIALERRRGAMAAEEVAKSNLLFQKMGIMSGGDSDDDDDDEETEEVAPQMPKAAAQEQEECECDSTKVHQSSIHDQIEAISSAAHEEELSAAKVEVELLSTKLAAAVDEREALAAQFQVYQAEKALLEEKSQNYEDQIAQSRRLLEEKASSVQASVTEGATLKTKAELLERQVATLQASGERAEAERSSLAAENAELNDKLKETLAQLASTQRDVRAANDNALFTAKAKEEQLRSELINLHEELSIVQNALKASDEAAEAAHRRAAEALCREESARQKALAAEEEKCSADRVADEALVEAEYLKGEITKLEREVCVAHDTSAAAVAAATEVLKAQHATEFSKLISKLQFVECENVRLLEESELHEKQAREIHAMVFEDARLSALRDAEKAALQVEEVTKLQAEKSLYKDQADAACARTAVLEAQVFTLQQKLESQVRSLTAKLHLMQHNEVATLASRNSALKEVEILKEKLSATKSEVSKLAATQSAAVFEANKRIQEAETRSGMLEKELATIKARQVPAEENHHFVGGSSGGVRCGLIERKRSEMFNVDLEAGGTMSYESDSSHDGEERGPLTAFALRFGLWTPAVTAAKTGDRATLAARVMLKRQHSAVRFFVVVYLLALHVLLVTGRMFSAI